MTTLQLIGKVLSEAPTVEEGIVVAEEIVTEAGADLAAIQAGQAVTLPTPPPVPISIGGKKCNVVIGSVTITPAS